MPTTLPIPLITGQDIIDNYPTIVNRAGITSQAALDRIAKGAISDIRRVLGFEPQLDKTTKLLSSVEETLDGGRPIVSLLAEVDSHSTGAVLQVYELGTLLTRRPDFTSGTGDFTIAESGRELYRLAGAGARTQGIWGANSAVAGGLGLLGGMRLEGDYKDLYRACIRVVYTPNIDLDLLMDVALDLCQLKLLARIGGSYSASDDEQSVSFTMPGSTGLTPGKDSILARLPRTCYLGTGG